MEVALSATSRGTQLDSTVFQMPLKAESMPFGEMVSTDSATDWYSPKASELMAPCFDLRLLRQVSPTFNKLNDSWLGGQHI